MEENAMADRLIECPCGIVITAENLDAVVSAARRHAREVHEMDLTDDDARAMARPA